MTENGLKRVHPQVSDDYNDDDQQNEQPVDSTTQQDSSRYHYQPQSTPDTPAKKVKVVVTEEKVNTTRITDIASSFLERLSL